MKGPDVEKEAPGMKVGGSPQSRQEETKGEGPSTSGARGARRSDERPASNPGFGQIPSRRVWRNRRNRKLLLELRERTAAGKTGNRDSV